MPSSDVTGARAEATPASAAADLRRDQMLEAADRLCRVTSPSTSCTTSAIVRCPGDTSLLASLRSPGP